MGDNLGQTIGAMKPADKVIGGTILVVGAGVLGYGLYWILPYLIAMAANTIYFAGELVILAVLAMVFLDKDTWINMYYWWKNLSRSMRRSIISSDPIGTLTTVVHRYESKLEEINQNIVQADAATKRQKTSIADALKQRDSELGLAKAADRMGKDLQVGLHATNAERWETSAKEMQPMYDTLINAVRCMERARDLCEVRLGDIKNQKDVLAKRLDAMMSGQKAVRKIKMFLGSNPDLEMQELAVEDIERKSSEALAEIDQFMRVITPSLDANDLLRSAEQMAAMDHFDKFIRGEVPAGQLTASTGTAIPLPKATIMKAENVATVSKEQK